MPVENMEAFFKDSESSLSFFSDQGIKQRIIDES